MPTSLLDTFKNEKKKFDAETKNDKAASKLVAAAKKSSALEKAAAACDVAIKKKDAGAYAIALADIENASKIYAGSVSLEMIKMQKAKNLSEDVQYATVTLLGTVKTLPALADSRAPASDGESTQMKPSSFLGDWKEAKKNFEAMTGKKKPSTTFLGSFRKSSGLESAVTALDAATRKSSVPDLEKAIADYKKAAADYGKTVAKAAKVSVKETDMPVDLSEAAEEPDYNKWVEQLLRTLNQIRAEAEKILKAAKK
jgi:hypothetical protein